MQFYISHGSEADIDNLITGCLDLLQKAGIISNDRWVRSVDGTRKWWKFDEKGERINSDGTLIQIWETTR
jgi:Holliday junction resolvase RusA-like endonuclease